MRNAVYKILISGYYGFNNIGDESILTALTDNLKSRLEDIEITVLSSSPRATAEKHAVRSVNRKSLPAVLGAVCRCDLLISGGGSLLQDVTSRRSILYYLAVMWAALLFRKKVFVYSQGIGPIGSARNRRLAARVLKKAAGIVVRDEDSRELLADIGISKERVAVTADPVLRIRKAELAPGRAILEREGLARCDGPLVGFAVKDHRPRGAFIDELRCSMERLATDYGARIVLIPFHYSEDTAVAEELEAGLNGKALALRHKYLTDEMLSVIGNMDVLVGVRLHALIYAAVMNVPMIGVSYDPKVNAFLHTMDMKAVATVYDFKSDYFMEEFERTLRDADAIRARVARNVERLTEKLDINEAMIGEIMKGARR